MLLAIKCGSNLSSLLTYTHSALTIVNAQIIVQTIVNVLLYTFVFCLGRRKIAKIYIYMYIMFIIVG